MVIFVNFLQGFVISDMRGIDRITTPERANYTYSVQAGIHAGIDMVSKSEKEHKTRNIYIGKSVSN